MANQDVQQDAAEMSAAAQTMRNRIGDLGKIFTDLSSSLEYLDKALTGSGAEGLVKAIEAWAQDAAKLPELLLSYANAIDDVAYTTLRHDLHSAGEFQKAGHGGLHTGKGDR